MRWILTELWEVLHRHSVKVLELDDVPTRAELHSTLMWVQIYDLSIGFMSEAIGRQIGDALGGFIECDIKGLNKG